MDGKIGGKGIHRHSQIWATIGKLEMFPDSDKIANSKISPNIGDYGDSNCIKAL